MNIIKMKKQAEDVSALLKILSHPKRLLILCQLVEQEKSVGELAAQLKMREAAVSQQLALLRKDKLVKTRRDGQTIYYHLASDKVRRGLVSMAHAYGDADATKENVRERGASTNRLVSEVVDYDPITGQSLQSAIPVKLEPA
jgi:DNA-binding transcriptional ArsR family regulator